MDDENRRPISGRRRRRLKTPRAMLDGGGETLITLGGLIQQRMGELARGEVLEIASTEPSTRAGIPPWCRLAGHDLLDMEVEGYSTRFWIRKG